MRQSTQRIIDRSYVGEVLQHLHSSDVNVDISFVSSRGYFYLFIGEKKISLHGTSVEEAVTHLASIVAKEFPNSNFAMWWINNF